MNHARKRVIGVLRRHFPHGVLASQAVALVYPLVWRPQDLGAGKLTRLQAVQRAIDALLQDGSLGEQLDGTIVIVAPQLLVRKPGRRLHQDKYAHKKWAA
jgi:hypothetical protein